MLPLSSLEKQEIIRCLEENTYLPEKYRYRLFQKSVSSELIWKGKTKDVKYPVFPLQVSDRFGLGLGWSNKLIEGDNAYILSALLHKTIREEIEDNGGISLIYIDPPFSVGGNFSVKIPLGNRQIELLAYRDIWKEAQESLYAMLYPRFILMHELLNSAGTIYVHCDCRSSAQIRLLLDEVFGQENFLNEIIWTYDGPQSPSKRKFASKHDTIFRYAKDLRKTPSYCLYTTEYEPFTSSYKYKKDADGRFYYTIPTGDYTKESLAKLESQGLLERTRNGSIRIKKYVSVTKDGQFFVREKKIPDVWHITSLGLAALSRENFGYPTQKPEALLERIIKASSKEGDIVADFFCGSGTLAVVCEKLGRKWICCDSGRSAIETSRKRILAHLSKTKISSPFTILRLTYDFVRDRICRGESDISKSENSFFEKVLALYGAKKVTGLGTLVGKLGDCFVAISCTKPVSRTFISKVLDDCRRYGVQYLDILGFSYECNLFPKILEKAKKFGIALCAKYIPFALLDRDWHWHNPPSFFPVGFASVNVIHGATEFERAICLTNFTYVSTEESVNAQVTYCPNGSTFLVGFESSLIRITKDRSGTVSREICNTSWKDVIASFACDFQGEKKTLSKDALFTQLSNFWQSVRLKKNEPIFESPAYSFTHEGTYTVYCKVVDILGSESVSSLALHIEPHQCKNVKNV